MHVECKGINSESESHRARLSGAFYVPCMGGGQHLKQPTNVDRPIFRYFEITNFNRTKDELFDFFVYNLFCIFIFVQIIRTLKIYYNLRNRKFRGVKKICYFLKL